MLKRRQQDLLSCGKATRSFRLNGRILSPRYTRLGMLPCGVTRFEKTMINRFFLLTFQVLFP